MKKINALVTSVGGIVAQGIIKSLKFHNNYSENKTHDYIIYGTDIAYESSGLFRVDKFSLIGKPDSEGYIDSIISICNNNDIDIVFIGSDVELAKLSNNQKQIESNTHAKILTNPFDVIERCRDKYKTYQFLKENNLNYIPSCLVEDSEEFIKEYKFPLIVKPCEGFGSKLFFIVNDGDDLAYAVSSIQRYGWRPLMQKYLGDDNKEFTTGVTINRNGLETMSSIVIKKILKHGQTYKAIIDDYPEIKKISEETAKKIGGIGAINIQLRVDVDDNNDKAKIIEVNPRFSATCPLRTVAGINEPDIVMRNTLFGENIKIMDYKSLICLRYWNETYLDLERFMEIKNSNEKTKSLKSTLIDYF
jgi:carbamoyl-phosphate synthase large subunit